MTSVILDRMRSYNAALRRRFDAQCEAYESESVEHDKYAEIEQRLNGVFECITDMDGFRAHVGLLLDGLVSAANAPADSEMANRYWFCELLQRLRYAYDNCVLEMDEMQSISEMLLPVFSHLAARSAFHDAVAALTDAPSILNALFDRAPYEKGALGDYRPDIWDQLLSVCDVAQAHPLLPEPEEPYALLESELPDVPPDLCWMPDRHASILMWAKNLKAGCDPTAGSLRGEIGCYIEKLATLCETLDAPGIPDVGAILLKSNIELLPLSKAISCHSKRDQPSAKELGHLTTMLGRLCELFPRFAPHPNGRNLFALCPCQNYSDIESAASFDDALNLAVYHVSKACISDKSAPILSERDFKSLQAANHVLQVGRTPLISCEAAIKHALSVEVRMPVDEAGRVFEYGPTMVQHEHKRLISNLLDALDAAKLQAKVETASQMYEDASVLLAKLDVENSADAIDDFWSLVASAHAKENSENHATKADIRRLEDKQQKTTSAVEQHHNWVVNFFKNFFAKIFGVRKTVTPEGAQSALAAANESYLACFTHSKLKDPHRSQVIAVARWTHNGHPLDYQPTQSAIQNRTAYTLNQAAADVIAENYEKWSLWPDAWLDAKLLADACRAFTKSSSDPFAYKRK